MENKREREKKQDWSSMSGRKTSIHQNTSIPRLQYLLLKNNNNKPLDYHYWNYYYYYYW